MSRSIPFVLVVATSIFSSGCATHSDRISAIKWARSAEGAVSSAEIYQLATLHMLEFCTPEMRGVKRRFAIAMDIDETVLDNSQFQLSLKAPHDRWSDAMQRKFDDWALKSEADAVVGAVEFINSAEDDQCGISIFYVSNRDAKLEIATRENLKRVGIVLRDTTDTVLLTNEHDSWTMNKQSRWNYIEQELGYKIIMYVGDALTDFPIPIDRTLPRNDFVKQFDAHWGRDWVLVPNPMYGNW